MHKRCSPVRRGDIDYISDIHDIHSLIDVEILIDIRDWTKYVDRWVLL